MREIEWRQVAQVDLLDVVEYIADDNPDAAQALYDEISTKVNALAGNPFLYRSGRVTGTREMTVRHNYIVVYGFDDRKIDVLRVLHTSRQWP